MPKKKKLNAEGASKAPRQGGKQEAGLSGERAAVRAALAQWDQEDLAPVLNAVLEKSAQPGADVAWLAAYDDDVWEAALILLAVVKHNEDVPRDIMKAIADGALPVIEAIMGATDVPSDRKLQLAAVGMMWVHDMDGFPAIQEAAQGRLFEEHLVGETVETLTSDPEILFDLIHLAGSALALDDSKKRDVLEFIYNAGSGVKDRQPAASAMLLASYAVGVGAHGPQERACTALGELASLACPEGRWCLETIGRLPNLDDAVRKEALRQALRLEGVGRVLPFVSDRVFSHGLLSVTLDGGLSTLALFFHTPRGTLDAMVMTLEHTVRVHSAGTIRHDGALFESHFREEMEKNDIDIAPCSLEFARELVADCWAAHEASGAPLPSGIIACLPYLGDPPIVPARREPDLSAYGLDDLPRTKKLVQFSDDLADMSIFPPCYFHSDAAFAFVADHAPPRAPQLSKAKRRLFVRTIAAQEQGLFVARLAANLEIWAWAGLAKDEDIEALASVYVAIKEGVVPFCDVPLVTALADASTEDILEYVRAGFSSYEEVREAMEDEPDEYENIWGDDEEPIDVPF
ncbi:MAG TPA: hypothetical protein ENN80_00750 [Candidatus Hydrogenedentes bacterium]|nr:hypothetical protein [Candidatus Hydrogenedentota bacterium]